GWQARLADRTARTSAPSRIAAAAAQASHAAATSAGAVHQESGIATTGPARVNTPRVVGEANGIPADTASANQGTAGSASTIAYAAQRKAERAPVRDAGIARSPPAATTATRP